MFTTAEGYLLFIYTRFLAKVRNPSQSVMLLPSADAAATSAFPQFPPTLSQTCIVTALSQNVRSPLTATFDKMYF